MRSGDLAYWVAWVGGGAVVLACVALTWWGLFGDRGRGRRRCPRCWFDLSHTTGLVCTECGRAARHERQLHRTRRRLVPAMAAAAVAAVGTTIGIEHVEVNGWVSAMPTRVLVAGLPLVGGAYDSFTLELSRRFDRRRLTEGQIEALAERCLAGDPWARPPSSPWESKYGGLLDRCRRDAPAGLKLDARLLAMPARIELSSPRSWPTDAPMCLELTVRDCWPPETECRIHVTPQWTGAEPIVLWRNARRPGLSPRARRFRQPYPLAIAPPPQPASPLRFEVELERLTPDDASSWQPVQHETLSVDVEFAGTIASMVRPSAQEGLDEAVRDAFSRGVVKWTSGRSPVRVRYDPRRTYSFEDQDLAIGASVEILFEETVARRLDIWWPVGATEGPGRAGWVVSYEDEQLIAGATGGDGLWRMRVRGDPALALRAGNASTFWAGEFTVPLTVDERDATAPPKFWWRLPH